MYTYTRVPNIFPTGLRRMYMYAKRVFIVIYPLAFAGVENFGHYISGDM